MAGRRVLRPRRVVNEPSGAHYGPPQVLPVAPATLVRALTGCHASDHRQQVDTRHDSQSTAIVYSGLATNVTRMKSHLKAINANLTRDKHGASSQRTARVATPER